MIVDDRQMHIRLKEGEAGKYAILPGDPGRCEKIAKYLDNPRFVMSNREHTTWVGELDGELVSVVSTGMGGPSTAICVEELAAVGVHTMIRLGTCGGIQLDVESGDLVISTASIRQEGTTCQYVPIEYPAVADFNVVMELKEAAMKEGAKYHLGVSQSKDSFYGQHSPERMPIYYELEQKWEAWKRCGCLCSEMESSTLFILGQYLRLRTGAVFCTVWNQERAKLNMSNGQTFDTEQAARVTVAALRSMIAKDKAASK